jgi:hypothetical protein
VPQLPHVPRPIGEFEACERLERQAGWNDLARWPDALTQEAIGQEGNFFRALGKPRKIEDVVAEAITEVGEEHAARNQFIEAAVHTDHEACPNADASVGAERAVFLGVEHAEQQQLLAPAEVLEVVEEDRAAAGFGEETATARDGAGECTTLVTE